MYRVKDDQFAKHTGAGATGYCAFDNNRVPGTHVVYMGSSAGVVKQRSDGSGNGETDDGANILSKYQSKAFRADPSPFRTREGELIQGEDDYIQVNQVLANISPVGASASVLKIGTADTGNEAPSLGTATDFNDTDGHAPAANPKFNESSGRYITVEISDFDYLSDYDIDYEGAGIQ